MGGQGAARHHLVTEGASEVLLWDFLQGCQPFLRAEAGAALLVAKGVHERQNSCVFTCFVTLMYTFCCGAPFAAMYLCRSAPFAAVHLSRRAHRARVFYGSPCSRFKVARALRLGIMHGASSL